METIISTLTSKSQTVIPKAVRKTLGLKPGDRIRYRVRKNKVEIEKLGDVEGFDPFMAFTEWGSAADEKAFANLKPSDES